MHHRYKVYIRRFLLAGLSSLLLAPALFYGWLCILRPSRSDRQQVLFQGIVYQRRAVSQMRPVMLHIVTIDLSAPGVKPLVTPGLPEKGKKTNARTTSEFLNEFKLQLAVNGSYFHHFYEKSPWDYYPHSGDPSYPLGEVISNGHRYSKPEENKAVLCFAQNNLAQIFANGKCPKDTFQAIAGQEMLVTEGKPVISHLQENKPYPRLAAAINQKGNKLWLIAVDGKQPFYSEGLTLTELTKTAIDLGADAAINMDGGGSVTLVMGKANGAKILNAPAHTKLPMRERPVGNHLGFYALPTSVNTAKSK
ncbi:MULTISPECIES: phosphodiester glycosidase family protein [unclassified Tolypothrix]|uniref:phosphodiester glycosidase family protein n=1 Tax=unclassified Tolypothrix TaxID=2649714 RepID=UPI0018828DA8|nr:MULTISPECIES: phosphodiester glycosidase family protein [unclassified Tolypothrix]MBE9082491.1 phosphodiester glycosidase family protein [Tolypothrix sp. LEGE 11397]UYD25079.1 phosphodiester glycosidase family protein [Tolypothrix sp. PCC 7712]UYD32683.1 phosphodiester glycosidase family protein [Tolypothrix sp. PCC 7601]